MNLCCETSLPKEAVSVHTIRRFDGFSSLFCTEVYRNAPRRTASLFPNLGWFARGQRSVASRSRRTRASRGVAAQEVCGAPLCLRRRPVRDRGWQTCGPTAARSLDGCAAARCLFPAAKQTLPGCSIPFPLGLPRATSPLLSAISFPTMNALPKTPASTGVDPFTAYSLRATRMITHSLAAGQETGTVIDDAFRQRLEDRWDWSKAD